MELCETTQLLVAQTDSKSGFFIRFLAAININIWNLYGIREGSRKKRFNGNSLKKMVPRKFDLCVNLGLLRKFDCIAKKMDFFA